MPFLVGPAQPAIYVFLNWESKHKSLFFFLFLPFIGTLKILPTERELLDLYLLNLPYQDPEWVNFLNTTQLSSPPAELDSAFQSFMRLEFSVSAWEMVISLFKTIFFFLHSTFPKWILSNIYFFPLNYSYIYPMNFISHRKLF